MMTATLMNEVTCDTPLFIQYEDGTLAPIEASRVKRYGLKVGMNLGYGVIVEGASIMIEENIETSNQFRGGAVDYRTRLVCVLERQPGSCFTCPKNGFCIKVSYSEDRDYCYNVDREDTAFAVRDEARCLGASLIHIIAN